MDHKQKIQLIKSLLKEELLIKNAKFWPREIKIVNKLLQQYPNDTFWGHVGMKFKLNSLAWFLTDDGGKELKTMWYAYNIDNSKREDASISDQKFGEDWAPEKKQPPKTIADFFNE